MSIKDKEVTIEEFAKWASNNKNYTWYHGKGGGFDFGGTNCPFIKYMRPALDTRDMKVYRIECDRKEYTTDFRDEGEGTILDILSAKLEKAMKNHNKEMEKENE